MPFNAWQSVNTTLTWWRVLLLCLAILALRRLPTMYALYHWIPDIKTTREAIFAGHFGPMGVGAIFIVRPAPPRLVVSPLARSLTDPFPLLLARSRPSPPRSSPRPTSRPRTASRRSRS